MFNSNFIKSYIRYNRVSVYIFRDYFLYSLHLMIEMHKTIFLKSPFDKNLAHLDNALDDSNGHEKSFFNIFQVLNDYLKF